ncbi:MAG: C40 family peptidase [Bacilli bacterium]|nr:C40 family peptidase [Bacilli bacterium]
MSNTSVSGLATVVDDIATLTKKVGDDIQSINSKIMQLHNACTALSTYNGEQVAEEPTITKPPVHVMTLSDGEYSYLRYEQKVYENIWQIDGYEEGLEKAKYIQDSVKETEEEIKTQAKAAAAVILSVAAELTKNKKLIGDELEYANDLRKIANSLNEFGKSEKSVEYQKNDEGQKLANTANEYVGMIPYHMYDSKEGPLNPEDCGKPLPDGSIPPSGLDCSGFVALAYYKTTGKKLCYTEEDGYLMCGTKTIWAASTPISKSELKPGDVAFLQQPTDSGVNHIGIYYGKDKNGKDLWVHENSVDGNVSCNGVDYWQYYRRIK